jgi:hypothetical protein
VYGPNARGKLPVFGATDCAGLAGRMPGGLIGYVFVTWCTEFPSWRRAICKVAGVKTLYATDGRLKVFAESIGITVIGVHNLSLPPEGRQLTLDDLFNRPQEGSLSADRF